MTPGRATITDREGDRDRPRIAYYKTEKEFQAKTPPQGILFFDQIKECTIATDGKGAEANCRFDLVLASRRIHLIAENEKIAALWIKVIYYYMPPVPEETGVIYEGVLSKKSPASRHIWQKRFFVLDMSTPTGPPPRIDYYKSEKEKNSGRVGARLGTIELKTIFSCEANTTGKGSEKGVRFDITVCLSNTPLVLSAENENQFKTISLMAPTTEQCKRWVEYVDKFSKKVRDKEKEKAIKETPNKKTFAL